MHARHTLHLSPPRCPSLSAAAHQVLLVNSDTASTAELVAGALHDELAAPLVGARTYGKGRSQRVVKLQDGSTLLVSTLRYFTPRHTSIDGVGLAPDVACEPRELAGARWQGGRLGGDEGGTSLLEDPCVRLAAQQLLPPRGQAL